MLTRLVTRCLILAAITFTLPACDKDDDTEQQPPVEGEVITTLELTFGTLGGAGRTFTFKYDDPDGAGGNPAITEQIELEPNMDYEVVVRLVNKTQTPQGNVTTEIFQERALHRFYFQPSAGSNILVSDLDADDAGVPLGLTSVWTTGGAATGTIQVTLRHYTGSTPVKELSDPVSSGKSSTDVQATFTTVVQ